MAALLTLSPADSRLLPGGSFRRPTPYVIAVMTFAMMIVAAAGLTLARTASMVSGAVEHRFVLQLPNGGGGRLDAAVGAARAVPGIVRVEPVSEAEMRETLERWLGPASLEADLPVPALVQIDLAPGTDQHAVEAALERSVPRAQLVSESATVRPLVRSLNALQWLSLTLVLLMAAATSAAVVLATRAALESHRSTIDIMHGVGATDRQIAILFQRKIAGDALTGSLAGAALSALVLLLIAAGSGGLAAELSGGAPLGAVELLLLALMPFAIVAIATAVARLAVLRALRETP